MCGSGPGGIFRGMKSYPSWEDVRPALGDKVVDAIGQAVDRARSDLTDYRKVRPLFVAEASERGLAGWIHDRVWAHLVALLDETPGVAFVDQEPVREMWVGLNYRVRVKRHHEDGRVSTYPTQTALEFLAQAQLVIDGLDPVHLIAGYTWLREVRDLGPAVISLRDGNDIIWQRDLSPLAEGMGDSSKLPVLAEPPAPVIEGAATGDDAKTQGSE